MNYMELVQLELDVVSHESLIYEHSSELRQTSCTGYILCVTLHLELAFLIISFILTIGN